MSADQEITSMGKIVEAMEPLSPDERLRVLNWASQKYGVEIRPGNGSKPRAAIDISENAFEHSTDTIATALSAKSGADVVIAAAAHLHFAQGKQKFSRSEIITAMRTAPAYFKDTYVNNLTSYLTGLTKADRLRLISTDTYALSNKERQELTKVLADLDH